MLLLIIGIVLVIAVLYWWHRRAAPSTVPPPDAKKIPTSSSSELEKVAFTGGGVVRDYVTDTKEECRDGCLVDTGCDAWTWYSLRHPIYSEVNHCVHRRGEPSQAISNYASSGLVTRK
jgi:hypothetical protein